MVEYHLISAEDLSRLHQFGPKVLPGIFFGYAFHAVRIWKGDIMVADIEELEEMDASELHARRLKAKEVLTPMKGDNFIFPIADGTVKISGEDQDLRTSTSSWDRPDRGEEQGNLPGESSSTPLQDSSCYDGEAFRVAPLPWQPYHFGPALHCRVPSRSERCSLSKCDRHFFCSCGTRLE